MPPVSALRPQECRTHDSRAGRHGSDPTHWRSPKPASNSFSLSTGLLPWWSRPVKSCATRCFPGDSGAKGQGKSRIKRNTCRHLRFCGNVVQFLNLITPQ
jgi:hypothetical protein